MDVCNGGCCEGRGSERFLPAALWACRRLVSALVSARACGAGPCRGAAELAREPGPAVTRCICRCACVVVCDICVGLTRRELLGTCAPLAGNGACPEDDGCAVFEVPPVFAGGTVICAGVAAPDLGVCACVLRRAAVVLLVELVLAEAVLVKVACVCCVCCSLCACGSAAGPDTLVVLACKPARPGSIGAGTIGPDMPLLPLAAPPRQAAAAG